MKDMFKEDNSKSQIMEERESIRGKLIYYQELIYQNEKREKEEGELEIQKFKIKPVNIMY